MCLFSTSVNHLCGLTNTAEINVRGGDALPRD